MASFNIRYFLSPGLKCGKAIMNVKMGGKNTQRQKRSENKLDLLYSPVSHWT